MFWFPKFKTEESIEALIKQQADSNFWNFSQVLQFRPDCLEALHARARAYRESGNFQSAISDLTEALKISPQNRDVHRNIIKVKEEMKRKKDEEENNNNNGAGSEKPEMRSATKYGFPVGASQCDAMKFVDDSASEISHRSNN